LDFGGGYGMHYPIVKRFLQTKLGSFVICESPAVSDSLSRFDSEKMNWISDINRLEHGSSDVIISSGTIQYLSSPFETLESMSRLSKWIVLDRVPVIEGPDTQVMKQNTVTAKGERTSYPGWFFSEVDLLNWFERLGLKIEFEWTVPEDRPYVNGKRLPYRGYLLKKRATNE
jgi:putative methyltransferase (TIGR04325 family)